MPKTKPLQIEQKIIKDLGAKLHANSGAMAKKHDGSDNHHLYEIKYTEANQFILKFDYFEGVREEAYKRRLNPAMIIENKQGKRYVIIDYDDFKEYIDFVWERS